MPASWLVALTFIAYLALVLVIGVYAYLRTRDASDYFPGGRSLPPALAALSAGASDMSGWLLMGLPGAACRRCGSPSACLAALCSAGSPRRGGCVSIPKNWTMP